MKFKIKNRPKRKYIRKSTGEIYPAKPLFIGLLPAIVLAAAFLAITLIKPYTIHGPIQFEFYLRPPSFPVLPDYTTNIINFLLSTLQIFKTAALALFTFVQTFADALMLVLLQAMTALFSFMSMLLYKLAALTNTLLYVLGIPFREMGKLYAQAQPYLNFVFSSIQQNAEALATSFRHLWATGLTQ